MVLFRKLLFYCNIFPNKPYTVQNVYRYLNYFSKEYGDSPNPAPIFIKKEVQTLLRSLTRVDLKKVYRKRKLGDKYLEQPTYKFMTDDEYMQELNKMKKNIDKMIQLPPILPVRKPVNRIFSKDPALTGFDTSKFLFTDISFGVKNSERLIVIRDIDGTLKEADWKVKDRINLTYFPRLYCPLKPPRMFDDEYLEPILERGDYLFILDRACWQFEPDDSNFQRVITITYQHINDKNAFETLRSTRHFGGLAFFLAWNKMIDGLLLELIETSHVDEAHDLISLYEYCNNVQFVGDEKIKKIEDYVEKCSNKKATLTLAIESFKELERQRCEIEENVKKAHGFN